MENRKDKDPVDQLILDLEALAIAAVEVPTSKNVIDRINRWYSREFSTPLLEVEQMNLLYKLRHYYEDLYHSQANSSDERERALYHNNVQRVIFGLDEEAIAAAAKKIDDDMVAEAMAENLRRDAAKALKEQGAGSTTNPAEHNLELPDSLALPDSGSFSES